MFRKSRARRLYAKAADLALKNNVLEAAPLYRKAVSLDSDYLRAPVRIAPPYIQVETIRACNAACIMCPLETSPTPNRVMSDELFDRIVSEVITFDPKPEVALHGLGEPLMDKRIVERIRKLSAHGVTVSIVSNATLMDEEKAGALLTAGIRDISFSIESVEQETYERIRAKLKLSDAIEGIEAFLRVRNRLGSNVPVRLMFTYSEDNRDQYSTFREFWKPRLREGDTIALVPIHSFGKFSLYNTDNMDPCAQIFSSLHIRADGVVSLCCIDVDGEYKIGDVTKQSIIEIFNGERIRQDRHTHLMGQRRSMKLCADCDQPESGKKGVADNLRDASPTLEGKFFVSPRSLPQPS